MLRRWNWQNEAARAGRFALSAAIAKWLHAPTAQHCRRAAGIAFVLAGLVPALGQSGSPGDPVPPSFDSPVIFDVPDGPRGIAMADIIGDDGFPEVAIACVGGSKVTVFENSADWSTSSTGLVDRRDYSVPKPFDLAFADMDQDTDLDLVISSLDARVIVLENDGQGHFGTPQDPDILVNYPLSSLFSYGLVVRDFDGNGYLDVAVGAEYIQGTSHKPQLEIAWSSGVATFTSQTIPVPGDVFGPGTAVVSGAFHTLQPSGLLDLAMSMESYQGALFVLENQGDTDSDGIPNWSTTTYPGNGGWGLTKGRFRNQQKLDLVTTENLDFGKTHFYRGNGDGTFDLDPYQLAYDLSGYSPLGVDAGILNVDTRIDYAVACHNGGPGQNTQGCVAVFSGRGDGTFTDPVFFATKPNATANCWFVRIGDLDNDGYNDLVTSNDAPPADISVFLNSFEMQQTGP